jgi:MFS family permease
VASRARGPFAILCGAHFLSYASYNGLTPVLALFLVAQGHDATFVGFTIAVFSITSVLVRPFAGLVVDHATRPRVYAAAAAALGAAGLAYLAVSTMAIVAGRIVQGAAWAVLNTAAPAMAVEAAPETQRGRAIGLLNMVRSVALPVAPPITLAIMAAADFGAALAVTVGAGLLSGILILGVPGARATDRGPMPRPTARDLIERSALLPAGLESLVYATAPLLFAFVPLRAQDLGIGEVGLVFLAAGVTMILVQPLGRLSDGWGRLPSVAIGFGLAACGLLAFAVAGDLAGLIIGGVLWAAGASFIEPATTAMAIDRAPANRRGAALATYTSAFQVGNAAGATLWGIVIATDGFDLAALAGAVTAAAGLVLTLGLIVRSRRVGTLQGAEA